MDKRLPMHRTAPLNTLVLGTLAMFALGVGCAASSQRVRDTTISAALASTVCQALPIYPVGSRFDRPAHRLRVVYATAPATASDDQCWAKLREAACPLGAQAILDAEINQRIAGRRLVLMVTGTAVTLADRAYAPLPAGTIAARHDGRSPRRPTPARASPATSATATAAQAQPPDPFVQVATALRTQLAGIAQALEQIAPSGGGLESGVGDFTAYVREVRTRVLPRIADILAQAQRLAAQARTVSATVPLAAAPLRHWQQAGVRLEAALLLALVVQMEVNVAIVASHANAAGVPFGAVQERLQAFDDQLLPLVEAALSFDRARIGPALAAASARLETVIGELDAACVALAKNHRQTVQVLALANVLTLALTLVEVARIPTLPEPGAPPEPPATIQVLAGGVAVAARLPVVIDARKLAELAQAVGKLVQIGALDPVFISGVVGLGGGPHRIPGLQKPLLMAGFDRGRGIAQGQLEALGEGPEVDATHIVTNKKRAGMARIHRHHVLPQDFRAWFEARGFKGELDINNFCVELEEAHHEAIHGGGNRHLAKQWPDEWNNLVMGTLSKLERAFRRKLTPTEILNEVKILMRQQEIDHPFVPFEGN